MLPAIDILYLVQEHNRLMRINRRISLKDFVQFLCGYYTIKSLIVKVDIEHFFQRIPILYQIKGILVQHI